MDHFLIKYICDTIEDRKKFLGSPDLINDVERAADLILDCIRIGRKVIIAGNGGSAADSQHIAAEFVSRFKFDRPGLPALAITTDTSALTAIGNDYGYEFLFQRQLQALAQPGDVFIGITTSGRSANILKAVDYSVATGLSTILLTGSKENTFDHRVNVIRVPSTETCFIQEMHITVGHYICDYVERSLFK